MPTRFVYVIQSGKQDPSRWLHIAHLEGATCQVFLQDLCHPGKVSQLASVRCPIDFLRTAVNQGPLQLTTGTGYVIFRRVAELVQVEFRGLDDISITKVAVSAEDLLRRLDDISSAKLVSVP